MQDIQVISGPYVSSSFNILPTTDDRVSACLYFCQKSHDFATDYEDQTAKWYFRAALSEYQAALESVDHDVKRIFGKNLWKESRFQTNMMAHPLVKILTKLRNFSVHSARLSGELKSYFVVVLDGQDEKVDNMRSIFIDQLDRRANVKDISGVTSDEIAWFNRQSACWPADLLLRQALYEASKFVQGFLASAQRVDTDADNRTSSK